MRILRFLLAGLLLSSSVVVYAAPDSGDSLDRSWNSAHWQMVGVYGDTPNQVAMVVDRDSVTVDPVSGRAEFNWLIVLERRPPRSGSIVRQWADCKKQISGQVLAADYDRGQRRDREQSTEVNPFKPDSELHKALHAVCTGDWSALKSLDASANDLSFRAFGL